MLAHGEVAKHAADQTEIAGAAWMKIVDEISHIKELNGQIAVTTEEQAAAVADITHNINHIKELSLISARSAEATTQKSEELNQVCDQLSASSKRFII